MSGVPALRTTLLVVRSVELACTEILEADSAWQRSLTILAPGAADTMMPC